MTSRWWRPALWQWLSASAALAAIALLVHMFRYAPYDVSLTVQRMKFGTRLRVLHLSDLHSSGLHERERDVLELVRRSAPDLIVVTGDSVDPDAKCSAAAETLDALSAPLGVWVVPGNWEYWMAARQGSTCLCPSTKAHCLRNQAHELREGLWIAGLDDLMAGKPSVSETLRDVPADAGLLLLAHEPTALDQLERRALVFAGHTHGGQVCLPGLGALVLPPESGRYVSGWYQRGEASMYVSRGVGTSILPVRLWCTPEVTLFELSR